MGRDLFIAQVPGPNSAQHRIAFSMHYCKGITNVLLQCEKRELVCVYMFFKKTLRQSVLKRRMVEGWGVDCWEPIGGILVCIGKLLQGFPVVFHDATNKKTNDTAGHV